MTNTTEATGQLRIATYIRISTDEENQPFSLEAQELRLGAYVQSQDGWQVAKQYADRMCQRPSKSPQPWPTKSPHFWPAGRR